MALAIHVVSASARSLAIVRTLTSNQTHRPEEFVAMDLHPGLRMPTDLRRCSWCGEAEKPSQKMKKCAACEYVIYCSKLCQRSAWDDHKYVGSTWSVSA